MYALDSAPNSGFLWNLLFFLRHFRYWKLISIEGKCGSIRAPTLNPIFSNVIFCSVKSPKLHCLLFYFYHLSLSLFQVSQSDKNSSTSISFFFSFICCYTAVYAKNYFVPKIHDKRNCPSSSKESLLP